MARKRALFRLESFDEVNEWFEAFDEAIQQTTNEDIREHLTRLQDFAEGAEPGQMVVLKRSDFVLAKSLGALPLRLRRVSFEQLPEGIPTQIFTGRGREIIPGVFEETQVMIPMSEKGQPSMRFELSRADIESTLRESDIEPSEEEEL